MSKVQVDTIDTRSGTSTMQIGSTNTSTINIGVSGDTVNIPSGVTIANAGTATGFGESNTPAFLAKMSAVQSIANTTDVTVQFNSITDGFDTDSGFNTGTYTYTIPSGKGGKYYMFTGFYLASNVADKFWATKFVTTSGLRGEIYGNSNSGSGITCRAHMIQNFSAGDTVYVRVYHNFGGAKNTGSGIQNTYFGGFRITAS